MPFLNRAAANVHSVIRHIPFFGSRPPRFTREQALKLKPKRGKSITWEPKKQLDVESENEMETPEELMLTAPRGDDALGRLINRIFRMSATRQIELDEFGSAIWHLCDGTHSIQYLIDITCSRYKLNQRQAEVSVLAFMKMLNQRSLIGYITEGKVTSHDRPQARPSHSKRRQRSPKRHHRH